MNQHSGYMTEALRLAALGRGKVSPNPMVGCVVVKNGQIIGRGYHQQAGTPHAEIHALREAGEAARDATAYITLEPCCHHGNTPPCTDALIAAGIKKIVAATLDPNPKVAGNGIKLLEAAGIATEVGLLQKAATQLNEVFFHYITHNRPFVIAKWAMSLDGKTITHPNDSRTISCPASQQDAHHLRQQVDAILIGANTATQDNPALTVRLTDSDQRRQPIRIILSTDHQLPLDLAILNTCTTTRTIVATTQKADENWCQQLTKQGVELMRLPENTHGQVDLPSLLDALGQQAITSLLVEGGMTVHHSFFNESLVNKIQVYIAPVIIGALPSKQTLNNMLITQHATDIGITVNQEESSHV